MRLIGVLTFISVGTTILQIVKIGDKLIDDNIKGDRKMKKTSLIFVCVLFPLVANAGWFGPKDYDECILESMKGVTSDIAARAIQRSCRKKFPKKKSTSQPPPKNDRLQKEQERLAQERRELERVKTEIERKRVEAERKRLEYEKKRLDPTFVIERDGMYVAYTNGVVKDTSSGLEWKVGPDRDMSWYEAKAWVLSLNRDGDGWRMPTMDELRKLHRPWEGPRHMTPLLKTTGWCVWSGETQDSSRAGGFNFKSGNRDLIDRELISPWDETRAFAVRPGSAERQQKGFSSISDKPTYTPPSPTSDVTKRREYIAYANGIVRDTETDLVWKAGPDRDTDWSEARSWVQSLNLDGGGWRMPTILELKTLYKKGAGDRNMTPLLKTTGWWVWSGEETEHFAASWRFGFRDGHRAWGSRYFSDARAFAVRSRSDG